MTKLGNDYLSKLECMQTKNRSIVIMFASNWSRAASICPFYEGHWSQIFENNLTRLVECFLAGDASKY